VKDNAFEMGRNQGYTANEIRAQWGKIKADCGAEPTPAMLAAYDADALLAIGVARPLSIYIDTHGTGKVVVERFTL
jgi:hypothetical protein